jgi:hypothetical protein
MAVSRSGVNSDSGRVMLMTAGGQSSWPTPAANTQ